jgi:hypothetical protein
LSDIDAHAVCSRPLMSELRTWLLHVSCMALAGVSLCTAVGCSPGEDDGEDQAPTPADASTAPSWTRCPPSDAGLDESVHASALAALVPSSPATPGPCAFGGCHSEASAKAKLRLSPDTADLRALLVGIPACEAPSLSLVDGRAGDEALTRSWLWQKLTAPAAIDGALLGQGSWGEASPCAAQGGATSPYGARMPQGVGPALLSDERLRAVQGWICAGAPDPRGRP